MYPRTLIILFFQILCFTSYVVCSKSTNKLRSTQLDRGQCKADAEEPWSYRGKNGPKYWGDTYPTCNGKEQSPIAINSYRATRDPNLPKLQMYNYDIPVTQASIKNNGHTVQITFTDDVERSIFVKNSTYRLQQMHFHWGDAFYRGSEHTLDRIQYVMELHLVHQNANNELSVVGVFFQESGMSNSEIQSMIKFFPDVLYKDTQTELTSSLNLNKLVPANPSSFYRYEGSLTTPDCAEGVTWSVLTTSLPVGNRQMAEFRKLYSATESEASPKCKLSNNYRPLQPLNQRQVFRSK